MTLLEDSHHAQGSSDLPGISLSYKTLKETKTPKFKFQLIKQDCSYKEPLSTPFTVANSH